MREEKYMNLKIKFVFALFFCSIVFLLLYKSSNVEAQEEFFQNEINTYVFNVAHVAYGSSSHSSGNFPASAAINRDRKGTGWGMGTGGWNDGTPNQFPDYLEVHFDGDKAIEEIDIYTLQDNYNNPVEPTQDMVFTLYGITDFDVNYWDAANNQWVYLGGARNNNKVWWQFKFPTVVTSKISITILNAISGPNPKNFSRITEVEVWGRDGLRLIAEPVGSPTLTDPDPCDGKVSTPCAPTITLYDAIKGDPLRYRNYPNMLDWNYQNWTNDSSKNLPVLAHAVTLWRPRSEWDRLADSNPDPVQWWRTFLNCQVGDPACPANVPSKLRYMKSDEVLSNTYDADTVRAVVSVFHWASHEMVQGRSNASTDDLAFKARLYLWKTWGLYALGAGYGSAHYLTHLGNRQLSLADKRCHKKSGFNKFSYTGPFMALAGMRSPWAHLCQEDRGPLFLRAITPEWPNMLPANAPADLRTPIKDNETSAQWALLDLIEDRREAFVNEPYYNTFYYKTENAYGLYSELRTFFVNLIVTGDGSETIRGFLQNTKLSVEYHFLAWVDSAGRLVRMTVMRENTNAATIPTYAVIYKSDRTAEAMLPFLTRSLTMQEYLNWQHTQPNSDNVPERAPRLCYRTDACYAGKDVTPQCYKKPNELDKDWVKCWTRQERGPGINNGYALLLNNSSETFFDSINPTRLKVSNLKESGEFPNIKHGKIVEWLRPLDIRTKRYHIAYLPSTGTWVNYW